MHTSPVPHSTLRPARHSSTLIRWSTLIGIYGSQTAALEALLRDSDELVKLKRAVRGCGLKPELLLSE